MIRLVRNFDKDDTTFHLCHLKQTRLSQWGESHPSLRPLSQDGTSTSWQRKAPHQVPSMANTHIHTFQQTVKVYLGWNNIIFCGSPTPSSDSGGTSGPTYWGRLYDRRNTDVKSITQNSHVVSDERRPAREKSSFYSVDKLLLFAPALVKLISSQMHAQHLVRMGPFKHSLTLGLTPLQVTPLEINLCTLLWTRGKVVTQSPFKSLSHVLSTRYLGATKLGKIYKLALRKLSCHL